MAIKVVETSWVEGADYFQDPSYLGTPVLLIFLEDGSSASYVPSKTNHPTKGGKFPVQHHMTISEKYSLEGSNISCVIYDIASMEFEKMFPRQSANVCTEES